MLMEYEIQLEETKIKHAEVLRPNYLIKIIPPNILRECPKCKHKWYDITDDKADKKKEKSKPFFKTDDEQKSFDSYEDDKKWIL